MNARANHRFAVMFLVLFVLEHSQGVHGIFDASLMEKLEQMLALSEDNFFAASLMEKLEQMLALSEDNFFTEDKL